MNVFFHAMKDYMLINLGRVFPFVLAQTKTNNFTHSKLGLHNDKM